MKQDVITDFEAIKRIRMKYREQLHSHKLNPLVEMDQFLNNQRLAESMRIK